MYELLNQIHSPKDLKKLTVPEMETLCREIRQKIIRTVATNGGHLSSNLGVVELTVALHRVFDLPRDSIVWDVGHQSYTHKILTGRMEALDTIRTEGGLCGFPKRQESPYDAFTVGHSSTSISAALGIATAKTLKGEPGNVVAVIGDGALTGGLAYEGLNNAGRNAKNLIVILNDNTMSISRNVGSITGHLTKLRTMPAYLKAKGDIETMLSDLPVLGEPIYQVIHRSKHLIKKAIYHTTLFEDLGFSYYGPINGHNIPNLIEFLENAKEIQKPVLLHVVTQKGRGYRYAERNPGKFHGVSSFNIRTGQGSPSSTNFSEVFGKALCELAKKDDSICAITAAMQTGTGLNSFAALYPRRFFDVGIAEQHAITFAGGLSSAGMKPVCAIYSTFLQRGFDQIIHDAAIQRTKVVLAIDRAGIVGEDGETHQGIFDVPFLNSVPNVTMYSPAYYDELRHDLKTVLYDCPYVGAVRYPRGKELYRPDDYEFHGEPFIVYGDAQAKIAIVTYGRLFSYACLARESLLEKGVSVKIVKLNQIKPIDPQALEAALSCRQVFFFEEGILQGGVGERFYFLLGQKGFHGRYTLRGVDNTFVPHAKVSQSLAHLGLDDKGMETTILEQQTTE
ncbi:MAG: 1-deoxy-D-xylulose-5-phosphate synthase [Oscillospiraceae bacterium]|nr:1-deoxy-D-xylulose-5-phosphate synthase [Oscillospiraceae bacterium]